MPTDDSAEVGRATTHEDAEQWERENIDWPQYYVSGHTVDEEDFVAAYFRVEGPNGPVSYLNPGRETPVPTTMHSLAMEAQSGDFEWVERGDTPFAEVDHGE